MQPIQVLIHVAATGGQTIIQGRNAFNVRFDATAKAAANSKRTCNQEDSAAHIKVVPKASNKVTAQKTSTEK